MIQGHYQVCRFVTLRMDNWLIRSILWSKLGELSSTIFFKVHCDVFFKCFFWCHRQCKTQRQGTKIFTFHNDFNRL